MKRSYLFNYLFYILFISVFLSSSLPADVIPTKTEKEWLKTHPVIRIGVDPVYHPYSFVDKTGKFQGVARDFVDRLSKDMGVKMEMVPNLTWPEIVAGSKNKTVDLIVTASYRPERDAFLNFSQIYLPTPLVVFTRKEGSDIRSPEDLNKKIIAVVKGYSSTKSVLKAHPTIIRLEHANVYDALMAVSTGKAEAFVGTIGIGLYISQKYGILNLKIAAPFGDQTRGQRFASRKDWPELTQIIDKYLDDIPDVEKTEMINKWLSSKSEQPTAKINFTPKEEQWLRLNKKIRIGIMNSWPPMGFIDSNGKPSGISADFVKLINAHLGNQIELVPGEWKNIYNSVKEKKLDGLMGITKRDDRLPFFNFTMPYAIIPHVIIAKIEDDVYNSFDDLSGKTVAIEKGFYTVRYLKKNYPKVIVKEYDSTEKSLQAVSSGEADAYIGNRAVAKYIIRKKLLTSLCFHSKVPLHVTSSTNSIGIRKDCPELANIIDKILKSLSYDQISNIYIKWEAISKQEYLPLTWTEFSKKEKEWLQLNKTVDVSILKDSPPYLYYKNRTWDGFLIDYIKLLAGKSGLLLNIKEEIKSKDNLVSDFRANKHPEVALGKAIDFSTIQSNCKLLPPCLDIPYALFVKAKNEDIQSTKDLSQKKIGVLKDSYLEKQVEKHLSRTVITFKNFEEAVIALNTSQIDAIISDIYFSEYVLSEKTMTNIKRITKIPSTILPSSLLTLATSTKSRLLTSILGKSATMITSQEKSALLKKWFPYEFSLSSSKSQQQANFLLTPGEQAWLKKHPNIRLGVDPHWSPFEFIDRDGRYRGISSSYIRLFKDSFKVDMKPVKTTNWKESFQKSISKNIDMLTACVKTKERKKHFL